VVTQQEIAERVKLDVSSVNKILNRRPGFIFKKETIKQVFKIARELGYDFGRLRFFHRRRHERQATDLPADVSIITGDGTLVEEGKGLLKDLSTGGARLADLSLPSGKLPFVPFELALRWRKGASELQARGRVVRIDLERRGLAVEFLEPPSLRAAATVAAE
jgi:hypothetical protein